MRRLLLHNCTWMAGVRLSMCLGWIGQRSQVQWERPLMFSLTTGIKQRINSSPETSACRPAGLCRDAPLPTLSAYIACLEYKRCKSSRSDIAWSKQTWTSLGPGGIPSISDRCSAAQVPVTVHTVFQTAPPRKPLDCQSVTRSYYHFNLILM